MTYIEISIAISREAIYPDGITTNLQPYNFPPSTIQGMAVLQLRKNTFSTNCLSSLVQIRDTKPVFLRFKTYFLPGLYHQVL